jgi:hypothetical protein
MEWFIPSLLALVLAAIVCFVFLPRLSPYTLGLLAIGMFAIGVWQHKSMFPYEYKPSLVTDVLMDYSPFIMVAAIILGAMIMMMVYFGAVPPSVSAAIPAMNTVLPATITKALNTPVNIPVNIPNIMNNKANNTKSIFNISAAANNTKRPNIASTSFMTV